MNDVRLRNFRILSDTGAIKLKPLTILVGANSSGKSSFLRFFPLLKQSFAEPKIGPVLWYKENGVDFGDFSTTVKKGTNNIGISFGIQQHVFRGRRNDKQPYINIDATIQADNKRFGYDNMTKLIIGYDDVRIEISFNESVADIIINGEKFSHYNYFTRGNANFFPPLYSDKEIKIEGFDELMNILRQANVFKYRTPEDFMFISFEDFSKLIDKPININKKLLFQQIVYAILPDMLRLIDMNIQLDVQELAYLGPFREEPHRYYRLQNLSTTSLDMSGSNMPIFINGMDEDDFKEFNEMLKRQYDFELCRHRNESGFVSLFIKRDGKETNIIDNGFGFSQIMPVLLSLFSFNKDFHSYYYGRRHDKLLCIEQPELHLHPTMQYEFGQNLCTILKDASRMNNKIIIETHSRSIINAIGEEVSKDKNLRNNIIVYLFDHDSESSDTVVRPVNFDDEGYLIDWPIGFLD